MFKSLLGFLATTALMAFCYSLNFVRRIHLSFRIAINLVGALCAPLCLRASRRPLRVGQHSALAPKPSPILPHRNEVAMFKSLLGFLATTALMAFCYSLNFVRRIHLSFRNAINLVGALCALFLIMSLVRKRKKQHSLAHLYYSSCSALEKRLAVASRNFEYIFVM